jgi:molybdopterin-guanine dinucleotide biosynthesis protein A
LEEIRGTHAGQTGKARRGVFAEFAHLRDAERLFVNVNTPEEIQALLRRPSVQFISQSSS